MLRSPIFWVLYVMFVMVSASGLMVAAQVALIAKDYGVAQTVILFGASTLTVAGIIDSLCNGGARPFFGWVSDQIGREYTMAIAFSLGALAYWLLGTAGSTPWMFVISAAIVFFTWGEIFSLFPSTTTDIFGPKFATTNTALMYTAKGTSAFVVPLANVLKVHTGSWHAVFVVASIMNLRRGGAGLVCRTADAAFDERGGKEERGGTGAPGGVRRRSTGSTGAPRTSFQKRQRRTSVRLFFSVRQASGIPNTVILPLRGSCNRPPEPIRNAETSILLPLSFIGGSDFLQKQIDNWHNVYQS